MRKFSKALLLLIILNMLTSFAYAGEYDSARPDSVGGTGSIALNADDVFVE